MRKICVYLLPVWCILAFLYLSVNVNEESLPILQVESIANKGNDEVKIFIYPDCIYPDCIKIIPEVCIIDDANDTRGFEEWYNRNSSIEYIIKRNKRMESLSGPGSSMRNTFDTVSILKKFLATHSDITAVADIPCGDTNWQFSIKELNTLSVYFGGDVSSLAINDNIQKYKAHKNKLFAVWDLALCQMPQYQIKNISYDFDLVISRDVIQHLPLKKGLKFIKNVIESNAKYYAVTSFIYPKINYGTTAIRGWYANNLEIEPFNLNCTLEGINCLIKQPSHKTFIPFSRPTEENDFLIIYEINHALKQIVSSYDV